MCGIFHTLINLASSADQFSSRQLRTVPSQPCDHNLEEIRGEARRIKGNISLFIFEREKKVNFVGDIADMKEEETGNSEDSRYKETGMRLKSEMLTISSP